MIGTVVVPLDGSELAELALPYAQAIAQKSNAPLHLLRVVPMDAAAATEEDAREYLRQKGHQIGDWVQFSLRMGDAAEQIIDGTDEMIDPIIVITTHGRSGIGRWLHGSVADRVVRGSGSPVLLLRSATAKNGPGGIRSILVPLDGSAYAEAALAYAEEMAHAFEAELRLIRVAETTQIYGMMSREPMAPASVDAMNELGERLVNESAAYLESVVNPVRETGLKVTGETLEGYPGEQILAYEREGTVDLVIMATRGRAGLGRLVFGSVAERVFKEGTTPVMMVKPQGEIPEAESDQPK
jgi:nucleotide-binding universal stress UspA family protein